jgi:hypothetical protein
VLQALQEGPAFLCKINWHMLLSLQVEDLARLSFKRKPLYVGIDDSKAVATREGLEQVSTMLGSSLQTTSWQLVARAIQSPHGCRATALYLPTSASCCCSHS